MEPLPSSNGCSESSLGPTRSRLGARAYADPRKNRKTTFHAAAERETGPSTITPDVRSTGERLGIMNRMKSKLRPMPAEYNVEVVAEGGAEYVVVVASRIIGVPGVQLVGPIPEELQTWIGFTGGVCSASRARTLAGELLRFFPADAAAAVLKAAGIEPFVE
jgi:ABC-type molybdate transport system substrate-binding protein